MTTELAIGTAMLQAIKFSVELGSGCWHSCEVNLSMPFPFFRYLIHPEWVIAEMDNDEYYESVERGDYTAKVAGIVKGILESGYVAAEMKKNFAHFEQEELVNFLRDLSERMECY